MRKTAERTGRTNSLVDVISRGMAGRVAPNAIGDIVALIYPHVVDVHRDRENKILPILFLETRRNPQVEDDVLARLVSKWHHGHRARRGTHHRFFWNKAPTDLRDGISTYRGGVHCPRFCSLAVPRNITLISLGRIRPPLVPITRIRVSSKVCAVDVRSRRHSLLRDTAFVCVEIGGRRVIDRRRGRIVDEFILVVEWGGLEGL